MKKNDIPIEKIISRVKHLEIRARKLVEDTLSSEYHSVFKGRGIEFNEVRNYLPGDDVRDIDWNVTARMAEPYIKTYIEERQLTVVFAVDVSASSFFGSVKSKREMMAEIVALLGFASFFNNDRAGLVLFSQDIERVVPAQKNYSHLLRIVRDSWYFTASKKGTNLSRSFQSITKLLKKKAIIFVLSDFLDGGYEKSLMALSRKHEVIPIVVHDGMEENFETVSGSQPGAKTDLLGRIPVLIDVEDMEQENVRTIDARMDELTEIGKFRQYYRGCFKKLNLDYSEVNNRSDYFRTIETLLKKRMKKGR